MTRYDFYNDYGCGYFKEFQKNNPDFDSEEFTNFVMQRNKGDRDSGELQDIAKHEILRLAYEFAEYTCRF